MDLTETRSSLSCRRLTQPQDRLRANCQQAPHPTLTRTSSVLSQRVVRALGAYGMSSSIVFSLTVQAGLLLKICWGAVRRVWSHACKCCRIRDAHSVDYGRASAYCSFDRSFTCGLRVVVSFASIEGVYNF